MGTAEWIALAAVALSAVLPTLASWRAAAVRDARLDAKVDAIGKRLDDIERRSERHERLLEIEREARHQLELQLAHQEHDDD